MTKRKFYRTVIKVEVLSETPIPNNMEIVFLEIQYGSYSGNFNILNDNEIVDGGQVVEKLNDHGSDPEFFQLDEHGNDLEFFRLDEHGNDLEN